MDAQKFETRNWLTESIKTPFNNVVEEAKLTPRQEQIVRLRFMQGKLNYQIAMDMDISESTVRDELSKAYIHIAKVLKCNNFQ